MVELGVHLRSSEQARLVLWKTLRIEVDAKVIERALQRIGDERRAECQQAREAFEALPLTKKLDSPEGLTPVPNVVAIQLDGGCHQQRDTREEPAPATPDAAAPDSAALAVEPAPASEAPEEPASSSHWRSYKCAILLKLDSDVSEIDPCPEIPQGFLDIAYAEKLAKEIKHARVPEAGTPFRGEAADTPPASCPEAETGDESSPPGSRYEAPEVVYRHVVAGTETASQFGGRMAAEAWRLGFNGAGRKAALGDGMEYNWRIFREHFPRFTPILDFIHLLTYVFQAAFAGRTREAGRPVYLEWIEWTWSGQTQRLLSALESRLEELGPAAPEESETCPRRVVEKTLGYIRNNAPRMNYPEYRRQGLPITTCLVESTIKQMNYRAKGTEKHWSKEGVDAVLQLRADSLSDIHPLDKFWTRREAAATGQRPYRKTNASPTSTPA